MAASTLARRAAPTNTDIVAALGELHDCLHAVDQKIDDVKRDVGETRERIAKVEGFQAGIATKLRVGDPEAKPPSFMQRHKTPLATAGAVLGAMTAFVSLYPILRVVLLALDAALTAHK